MNSNQEMASVIREELREQYKTVRQLERHRSDAEDETTEDGLDNWLDDRISSVRKEILELIQTHDDVSDETFELLLVVVEAGDWEWLRENSEIVSVVEGDPMDPIKSLNQLETKYDLSIQEASQLLQKLLEADEVVESNKGTWIAINEFELY